MPSNRMLNADLRYDLMEIIDENEIAQSSKVTLAADKIAPPVEVNEESGHIPVLSGGAGSRLVDGDRAENGSFPRFKWVIGNTTYKTSIGGWEAPIDNISDYTASRFINLEEENAKMLYGTRLVGKEFRVSAPVNASASYGSNKTAITLAANNFITGTNMLEMGITASDALFAKHGCDLEQLSLILGTSAIRTILYKLADLKDTMKYTSPLQVQTLDVQLKVLSDYLGVKEVIPVTGRYNTSNVGKAPAYAKLWDQTQAVYALLSPGGKWDKSFARQPSFKKPIEGQDYILETYDEKVTRQSITRLVESRGIKIDYTCGYNVTGIFSTT